MFLIKSILILLKQNLKYFKLLISFNNQLLKTQGLN